MIANTYDHLFKIVLIGDQGVGKSSLMLRVSENPINEYYVATIGVDFKIRVLDITGATVKLQIWDTSGQERFQAIAQSYYKGAHGIVVVYSITDQQSFQNVKCWLARAKQYGSADQVNLIIGNRSDMDEKREVTFQQGKDLADSLNVKFIETSAKSSYNVEKAFIQLAEQIIAQLNLSQSKPEVKDQNQNSHQVLKLLLIGSSQVGKSCLLQRYCDNSFSSSFIPTIGVDFKVKQVDENQLKLQIWDTSGNHRFKNITSAYYKGAKGVILVYDVTNRQSFEDIVEWHAEANHFTDGNAIQILIGNKSDLEAQRQVTNEEGQSLADKLNVKFLGMNILIRNIR